MDSEYADPGAKVLMSARVRSPRILAAFTGRSIEVASSMSWLYFSARRSCIMKLEIPGRDEGILEDRNRAKLTRGKGVVAGVEDSQNNERRIFLA